VFNVFYVFFIQRVICINSHVDNVLCIVCVNHLVSIIIVLAFIHYECHQRSNRLLGRSDGNHPIPNTNSTGGGGGITTAAARNSSVKIFNDQILSCLYHLLADELNETVRIFLEDLIRQIDSKPNVGSFASNQSDNESTGQPHSPSYILCVSGRPANANNGEY